MNLNVECLHTYVWTQDIYIYFIEVTVVAASTNKMFVWVIIQTEIQLLRDEDFF